MMVPAVLLAKSAETPVTPKEAETLLGHTRQVCEAAHALTELAMDSLGTAMRIGQAECASWRCAVKVAALLHDLGKSNDHFQAMVRGTLAQQGIRHETLSLILALDLESWLKPLFAMHPPWVRRAVYYAVCGHHLKFPDRLQAERTGTEVNIYSGHPDFAAVLDFGRGYLGLSAPPEFQDQEHSLLVKRPLRRRLVQLQRELDADFTDTEKTLIASTKAALMASDVVGSVWPLDSAKIDTWVRKNLFAVLDREAVATLVRRRLGDKPPLAFQREVQLAKELTVLLEAGCGSGKSAAAYLWASRHADGRRLYFCYPTTTTASEGFAGYLRDPDFDAALVHSRAEVDYRLLQNMPKPDLEEQRVGSDRCEALDIWRFPAVVCTAHTVLGILENVRRGLYAWPALINAAFVFDEVHAYSDRLFSYLLRFLAVFRGNPVLLMTATLPASRRDALLACCAERGEVRNLGGPESREQALRYTLNLASPDEAWARVGEALQQGKKVLWIANTVDRAIKAFSRACDSRWPATPFHSRFRYADRIARQNALVRGFGASGDALLAVTTQVAEMSLDISADVLVSECAPVSAMIQRLGRLNRFAEVPLNTAPAFFIQPDSPKPYREEDWVDSAEWLDALADGLPKSQHDLIGRFALLSDATARVHLPAFPCEWIDGLLHSQSGVRAIEEASYAVEVIREEDLNLAPSAEVAIPMPVPKNSTWHDWKRRGRYLVAPTGTICYDEMRGASWTKP